MLALLDYCVAGCLVAVWCCFGLTLPVACLFYVVVCLCCDYLNWWLAWAFRRLVILFVGLRLEPSLNFVWHSVWVV